MVALARAVISARLCHALHGLAACALTLVTTSLQGGVLEEPAQDELRRAYIGHLREFLVAQGNLAESGCNLAGKGCSVLLLDTRRDYRLVGFRKTACLAAVPAGFVCSFEAHVSCAYSAKGRPNPSATDLYCGPLFNKTSSYTALLEYGETGWAISRFVQG